MSSLSHSHRHPHFLAVYVWLQPIVTTIEGSFSSSGSGGGIYGTQCGVKLANSKLQGNTAAANGGGAALQLCQVVLEGSTMADNQVRAMPGCLPALPDTSF